MNVYDVTNAHLGGYYTADFEHAQEPPSIETQGKSVTATQRGSAPTIRAHTRAPRGAALYRDNERTPTGHDNACMHTKDKKLVIVITKNFL